MIYVFLANGFEETEAVAPIDMLRRAGEELKTVGVTGKTVTSSHGITVTADITADEIRLDDALKMIVLPGGMPGTNNLEASADVQRAIDFCAENGRFIGAICAAPKIIGAKGLLNGRKAVCFPGFESFLEGADVQTDIVVRDGDYVTAKGAGAAVAFGLKLVEALSGKALADKLEAQIQCR